MFSKIFLIRWILLSVSMFIAGLCFGKRVRIIGIAPILIVTLIIAPLNIYYRDIARFIGVPEQLYFMMMGSILLNSIVIYYSSAIVPDFKIEGFSVAFFLSLIMTLVNYLIIYVLLL